MALLFFKSKESVLEWMGEIIEENMETHKEDCEGNLFDLRRCEERDGSCWWLVHKDGARMGHGISSLAMATNDMIKEQRYQFPDFTVYAIWHSDDKEYSWAVNW